MKKSLTLKKQVSRQVRKTEQPSTDIVEHPKGAMREPTQQQRSGQRDDMEELKQALQENEEQHGDWAKDR